MSTNQPPRFEVRQAANDALANFTRAKPKARTKPQWGTLGKPIQSSEVQP